MQDQTANPDDPGQSADDPIRDIIADAPKKRPPSDARPPRYVGLVLFIGFVTATAALWPLGEHWLRGEHETRGVPAPTVYETCDEVIRLAEHAPTAEDGIKNTAARIREQTAMLKELAKTAPKEDVGRLSLKLSDLRRVKLSLETSAKRPEVPGSLKRMPLSSGETSIKSTETQNELLRAAISDGAGSDLRSAVQEYWDACLQVLHNDESSNSGKQ